VPLPHCAEKYFTELAAQCDGGSKNYGGIDKQNHLCANLRTHCLSESMLDGDIPEYKESLDVRRRLMVQKIKTWFERL
jgi:hypothetical protein